ncbi:hypothetical protein M1D97_10285 [Kushneria sp. AK178]
MEKGLSKYFSGKPCPKGHVAWRSTAKGVCLECQRGYSARRCRENPEAVAAISSRWRKKNPDYAAKNRERINENSKKYRNENREAYAAHRAAYRARKANATPRRPSEFDDFVIKEAYSLAARRTEETGFSWEVDHIVPIAGEAVCGLHVAANIQVIPRFVNRRKSNRFNEIREVFN